MKIAITDDLKSDRDTLKSYITDYFTSNNMEADIFEYSSAEELLEKFTPGFFDIMFLDIYMDEMTGIEAARKIYAVDQRCKIIFLTTANHFAAESYEVKAVNYLIKPLTRERFDTAIKVCLDEIADNNKKLSVISRQVPLQIPFSKILYADTANRIVRLHLENSTLEVGRDFYSTVDPLLDDSRFIECYKGIVLNMEHIKRQTDDDFILKNGEKIPISKRKKKDFIRIYTEYTFENL